MSDHQQATWLNMRVQVEVLKIRKRVSVRAVDQDGLQRLDKRVDRQALLRRSVHESYDVSLQYGILNDQAHALIGIDSEYGVSVA